MTRTRGPGNLIARRPTTAARTYADAHQTYAAMIDQDLGGRRPTSYRAIDDGRPPSTAALMVRPLALFLFACLGFVIVLLAWLWQAGVFERFRPEARPQPVISTSWMGARQPAPSAATQRVAPTPLVAKAPETAAPADPAEAHEPEAVDSDDRGPTD
jgi:hypothetical protein